MEQSNNDLVWWNHSISLWDLKVFIASLGMPDHAHLKPYNQFVALIDMYLHPKYQLYMSNSFWDWLTKNKMPGKSSPEFQWTADDAVIQLNNYDDCLLKRLLH